MRIDVFHEHLPRLLQTALNWLSSVLMAGLASVLAWVCYQVVVETVEYGSTAQTPGPLAAGAHVMTTLNEYWRLGAAELGARYRDRELTPVEVVEQLFARIEQLNPP